MWGSLPQGCGLCSPRSFAARCSPPPALRPRGPTPPQHPRPPQTLLPRPTAPGIPGPWGQVPPVQVRSRLVPNDGQSHDSRNQCRRQLFGPPRETQAAGRVPRGQAHVFFVKTHSAPRSGTEGEGPASGTGHAPTPAGTHREAAGDPSASTPRPTVLASDRRRAARDSDRQVGRACRGGTRTACPPAVGGTLAEGRGASQLSPATSPPTAGEGPRDPGRSQA